MKIIKNNLQDKKLIKPYPRITTCDYCGSELEYEEDDVDVGYCGEAYVVCPVCNKETGLPDNEKCIILTKDNIKFPNHFCHWNFSDLTSNDIGKEIENFVKEAINLFRLNKDEYIWSIYNKDYFVEVARNDDDKMYSVTVAKDYYETNIDYEKEDYK